MTDDSIPVRPAKRPFVVKLSDEDHARLDYIADQMHQTRTSVVRFLIREAAEGNVPGDNVTFKFPPYSSRSVDSCDQVGLD